MANYNEPDFSEMAKRWPSTYVARDRVDEFTGGILHPRTLSNLDAKKIGPPEKIRIGRKIAYPVAQFIEWLESRAQC